MHAPYTHCPYRPYPHIFIYRHIHIYSYIYIQIYTYIHTYIYIYIYLDYHLYPLPSRPPLHSKRATITAAQLVLPTRSTSSQPLRSMHAPSNHCPYTAHPHIFIYRHLHIYSHIYSYIFIYTHICSHIYSYVYRYTYLHIYSKYKYIYIYMCIYIYLFIYTSTYTRSPQPPTFPFVSLPTIHIYNNKGRATAPLCLHSSKLPIDSFSP